MIDASDLPDEIRFRSSIKNNDISIEKIIDKYLSDTKLKEIEKRAVKATFDKNDGRRDLTAADLGISKRGLLNKVKEYGIN